MILNIDGFNSTPTDIKKFGAGALMLKNQETLQKGFLIKTLLTETFEESVPVIFTDFWFYYEGTNGRFFSVNEDKLNLFIDDVVFTDIPRLTFCISKSKSNSEGHLFLNSERTLRCFVLFSKLE